MKRRSLPWLLDLLAEGSLDAGESAATPDARKARLTHALTRMLLAASEAQPMILVVEDLHWIDRGSEELLRHLLNSISAARILMLAQLSTGVPAHLGRQVLPLPAHPEPALQPGDAGDGPAPGGR